MSDTRRKALAYLRDKGFRDVSEKLVSASKFYKPEESWIGNEAWWFDLPIDTIKKNKEKFYYLLGACNKQKTDFVILKVPNKFLIKNLKGFEIQNKMKRLHLALVDERGEGKVSFAKFVNKWMDSRLRGNDNNRKEN
jgi:hypothetical protein